ncbi:MAG: hypothetical protein JRF72_09990 [Deltaproteobacteria bacterium]|jgi:hypothetical protein|nr:hypothetical protein [Deltaproteobacteria bacterium]
MKTPQPKDTQDRKDGIPAAEESDVPLDTPAALPTSDKSRRIHPLKIAIIILSFVLIILVGLIVHTSNKNKRNYYLKAYAGALEVWKGTFSPAGKKRLIIMPGVEPPQKIKSIYTREEVYPLIFTYYIDKADALIHIMGMPDFIGIKTYLNRALTFATTDDHRKAVHLRLNRIDRAILYYKADVAASKGTRNGLEVAIEFLDQTASLEPDDIEAELIEKKKKNIRELMKAF